LKKYPFFARDVGITMYSACHFTEGITQIEKCFGFEVLTAVTLGSTILWVLTAVQ
jgi:hypothetical protein